MDEKVKCPSCQTQLSGIEKLCPSCGMVFESGPLPLAQGDNSSKVEQPLIDWKPKYNIGIKPIDDHHKIIVEIINYIGKGVKQGTRGAEFNKEIISRLKGYVEEHFSFEERLFKAAGYPDLGAHKKQHETFKKKVAEMEYQFFNSFFDLRGALDYIVKWFMNHTQKEDRKFVDFYLKSKKS